ncbi:hypothetical protein CU007_2048 [Enterococcus faecium]|nr:hypothetical protein [Enterococcus faecium]MBK4872992.1 hypothetical protein [Enterococcus faecium]MBK4881550.1 hypothetical protein [Enterococcus faecium]MBK4883823.1 hypothetical protein [Enterococcus faecium]
MTLLMRMKIKVKVEADLGIGILSSPFSIFLMCINFFVVRDLYNKSSEYKQNK